jgi:hypothetical protein
MHRMDAGLKLFGPVNPKSFIYWIDHALTLYGPGHNQQYPTLPPVLAVY